MGNLSLILVVVAVQAAYGHYQGPFLLWGVENLNSMKIPTLQAIDDQNLRDIYTKASAIVIFIRNATTKLSYENFPELSDIIGKNEFLYLPQELLSSDPLDYNVNAEVFTLTGTAESQDSQIAALYQDTQLKFISKNILGILAESSAHLLSKREVPEQESTGSFIYEAPGKCLLYTKTAPILSLTTNGSTVQHELMDLTAVTATVKSDEIRLILNFVMAGNATTIGFVFHLSGGNWYLTHIEYGEKSEKINVVGTAPSEHCSTVPVLLCLWRQPHLQVRECIIDFEEISGPTHSQWCHTIQQSQRLHWIHVCSNPRRSFRHLNLAPRIDNRNNCNFGHQDTDQIRESPF